MLNNIFHYRINLAIPLGDDGPEKCHMYNVNYTELLSQGIKKADPNWKTIPCMSGWEYNRSVIPYESISTEVSVKN